MYTGLLHHVQFNLNYKLRYRLTSSDDEEKKNRVMRIYDFENNRHFAWDFSTKLK